jgi:2-dehydro-3-deoxyphosphogalactonate aldolase
VNVAELRTFVVGNPPPSFGGRYFVFLTLTTEDGVKGVGEVYAATVHPSALVPLIQDVFEHHVEGTDPFAIEALVRRVSARGYSARPDLTLMGVLSGIEMACWDIVGKATGRPVFELLGGRVHDRLRAYTYLYTEPEDRTDVYTDPDLAAERAAAYLAQGFTALKFDPVGPYSAFDPRQPSLEALSRTEAYVARVREAVGDRCDLLLGTHGQLTPAGAVRLARRLERFDPLWFEEPVPPDSPEEMALVARATSIPVATGERLTTKHEFARVLRTRAAAILQPNLGRVGGLLEAKKIAGMAEAYYAQVAPHLYCGPVVGAANIQLVTCSPNFLLLEGIGRWDGFHAEILRRPIAWEDGYVIPPTEPGLGVELDEEVAARHPYVGGDLHLVPAEDPVA